MNNILSKIFVTMFLAAAFVFTVQAQSNTKKEESAAQKEKSGAIFKIPEGVMPMKSWKDFKGLLMLMPKNPSGIFISYPNEGETLDDLKARLEKSLVKMFVHDDEKVAKVEWKTISSAAHAGDKGETAVTKTFEDDTQAMQITFYERQSNNLDFVYGYFARKSKTSKDKDDSAKFLDENGKGNKTFDQFWKSFPRN